jgi:hypothetical protein
MLLARMMPDICRSVAQIRPATGECGFEVVSGDT